MFYLYEIYYRILFSLFFFLIIFFFTVYYYNTLYTTLSGYFLNIEPAFINDDCFDNSLDYFTILTTFLKFIFIFSFYITFPIILFHIYDFLAFEQLEIKFTILITYCASIFIFLRVLLPFIGVLLEQISTIILFQTFGLESENNLLILLTNLMFLAFFFNIIFLFFYAYITSKSWDLKINEYFFLFYVVPKIVMYFYIIINIFSVDITFINFWYSTLIYLYCAIILKTSKEFLFFNTLINNYNFDSIVTNIVRKTYLIMAEQSKLL